MIGYFELNGRSCEHFKMICTDAGIYGIAEKDIATISIPGRNGDLLIDNNRYRNIPIIYQTVCLDNFSKNFSELMNYIMSQGSYIRIEDTFEPDIFYLARYTGETNPKRMTLDDKGVFELTFNRKPQRFLKSGEKIVTYESSGNILNPTYMESLPLVRVYGTGTVIIGNKTIKIIDNPNYIDIDCDTQNAFCDTINCNNKIELSSGAFWTIPGGESNVALGAGITKVEIKPRWWKL